MKKLIYLFSFIILLSSCVSEEYKSSRKEREAIAQGNRKYSEQNFADASEFFQEALSVIPFSEPGRFNNSLATVRLAASLTDSVKAAALERAFNGFDSIANQFPNSLTASQAFYNMGNLMFTQQEIDKSIELYKKALRINPNDSVARRNLRIAQLNRRPEDKNNNNQNQDENENEDKKDKENDKQQQNQDQQNQNNNQQQQQPQQPQQPQDLKQGASDRILQRSQNRENEVRRQLYRNAAQQDIQKRYRNKQW